MEYFNRNQAWPSSGSITGLPVQAIPTKNKTKEWFKATMDALENIGLKQLDENQKFKDFYRMIEGKMSYMELKDLIPYLKDVEALRSGVNIPSYLKHYDLIGTIVNAFVGWFDGISDKYNVVGLDETEINQYTETKESLLHRYIQEVFDSRLKQELLNRGLDPDYNNFETEEEKQAYTAQIQQIKVSMTPPEIEKFMNTKWKSAEVMWASHTLENDRGRFYMDEIDKENFIDYLLTGRCFRNIHVGFDYYKPERWSPLNTFYSKTLDSKYPQYGDYIGRVHYYSASAIISRWGHMLTAKEKQRLTGGFESATGSYHYSASGGEVNMTKAASLGMVYRNQIIPFRGYYDYASIKEYERYTGIPQGIYTGRDSSGNEYQVERFLPNIGYGGYYNKANKLTDENIRQDLYQVTESYWISPMQVYIVTYQSPTGLVTQEIVTDELLQDFLKENGIKKISRTMKKGTEDMEVNTYFVDYIPQVRYGVKISGGNLNQDSIYLDGEPIAHQVRGDSNLYDFCLPVAGYVDVSLCERIRPYQVFFNYAINQISNILEKEIGVFFLADINFIPSEYKELGEDLTDVLANLMDVAKSTGLLVTDTSSQNTRGGVPFNQFSAYDLSQTNQLRTRMELAAWAKNNCYEMIGLTPQSILGASKYETATGVQQGVTATQTQTQIYFDNFDSFKRKALDIHLSIAQNCQSEGKDISVMYTKNDLTRAFLKIGTDGLSMRNLGVQPIINSKKREELERFKTYLLQINTAGGDIYDLASIFTSDSMVELMQLARNSRKYAEEQAAKAQQNQLQINQQNINAEKEAKMLEYQHKERLENIKGQYSLAKEKLQADAQLASIPADNSLIDAMSRSVDQDLKQMELQNKYDLERRKIDSKRAVDDTNLSIKMKELDLRAKELQQRIRDDETRRYVAGVNKN